MDLQEIVTPDAVIASLNATSKKHLMQEVAQRAADAHQLDARLTFEALLERERLGPTGMGRGVAIPHARLAGLERIVGCFTRCQRPVDFDAVDEEPVDLVFALFAPDRPQVKYAPVREPGAGRREAGTGPENRRPSSGAPGASMKRA